MIEPREFTKYVRRHAKSPRLDIFLIESGAKAIVPLFAHFFQNCVISIYLLNIAIIFDSCRRSGDAVTHLKYEGDPHRTFVKSKYN